ncbi:unnamed protein product, partial [marine sediment metagenome]
TIAELLAIGASVPIATRGKVYVRGRNDMATGQKLGIRMIIKDPDGIVVQDYQDWEFGDTNPGDDHQFIGGGFDIDKSGDWTIVITLAMRPDDPITVDSYSGVLCRVTEEFAGTIIKKELEYDSARGDIPVL